MYAPPGGYYAPPQPYMPPQYPYAQGGQPIPPYAQQPPYGQQPPMAYQGYPYPQQPQQEPRRWSHCSVNKRFLVVVLSYKLAPWMWYKWNWKTWTKMIL